MQAPSHGYRIDYGNLDVDDLVAQIRRRVDGREAGLQAPETAGERIRGRLRTYLDLDDRRPWELQRELGLTGTWNVAPEDLRRSGRRGVGPLIAACRAVARPLVKLAANLDLPLYKQFKVNLGVAEALHDLMRENAELRGRVQELSRRLERLERDRGLDRPERDRGLERAEGDRGLDRPEGNRRPGVLPE